MSTHFLGYCSDNTNKSKLGRFAEVYEQVAQAYLLEEEVGITQGITGILGTEVPIIVVDTVETGMKSN